MRLKNKTRQCRIKQNSAQLCYCYFVQVCYTVSLGLFRSYTIYNHNFSCHFQCHVLFLYVSYFCFHGLEHNVVYVAAQRIRPKFTIGQMKCHCRCCIQCNRKKYKILLFMRKKCNKINDRIVLISLPYQFSHKRAQPIAWRVLRLLSRATFFFGFFN